MHPWALKALVGPFDFSEHIAPLDAVGEVEILTSSIDRWETEARGRKECSQVIQGGAGG